MKQFKHKKFIGLALIVFLVFMVLGKYTQSTAFTSSSRVYATTVVDKNTGNKVRFEVRKIKGDKYEVKNTETGDTYQANAQSGEDRSLSFKLPGTNGSSDGTIRITPSMVPGGDAKVEMTESDTYTQVEGGSEVVESSEASSSSSSSQVMQAQNRLLTTQISQMQISRLRLMSMVIRKPLILQTIRLRTLSLSQKPLGNGSISLIMPRMLF